MRPNATLKALQEKFVRLRIVDMTKVDAALFEFDFDLTFSVFILNHQKNIHLRYGGRDDRSADTYLTEKSLLRALNQGLALHEQWKEGTATYPAPPEAKPVNSYPKLRELISKGQCIHCHQIGEAQWEQALAKPSFDKKKDPWPFPDPRTLGLIIDPDKGNVLLRSEGPAQEAGFKSNDTIVKIAGRRVHTFGDLQYALHKVPKEATSVSVEIQSKPDSPLTLALPNYWRVTDINRRSIGHRMTPFPEFWAKTLTPDAKKALGFKPDAFASEVTKFWTNTNGKKAGLEKGDIVYAVDGVTTNPLARNAMIYIRTHYRPGDEIEVSYRRGTKDLKTRFKLRAKPW